MKEDFLNKLKEAVDKFRGLEKKPIRIICHHDSDGVCSASILTKALIRENLVLGFFNQTFYQETFNTNKYMRIDTPIFPMVYWSEFYKTFQVSKCIFNFF